MALSIRERVADPKTVRPAPTLSLAEKVFRELGLSTDERLQILDIARSTYDAWRKAAPIKLSRHQIESLGYVFGIYDYSLALFGSLENVKRFLDAPESERPFNGRTPRATITSGLLGDLSAVFHWVLAQAQGF